MSHTGCSLSANQYVLMSRRETAKYFRILILLATNMRECEGPQWWTVLWWTAWYYLVSWSAHCPYFPLPSPAHIFMNLLLVITIKTNVSVQSVCGACSDHMRRECGVLFYHIYLQTFFTQLFMALGSRSEETISSSLHYIGKFPTQ